MKYENPFDEIVKQYYNPIFRYCFVRLQNEADAYDCTQEVFIIFYQKMDKLKLSENIRAWLYRTADNVMKNFRRKNKEHIPLDDIAEVAVEDNYSVESSLEGVVSEQEYEILKSFYVDNESIELISKRIGISSDAAYKRIYRIKAKIIKYIAKSDNQ